MSIEINNQSIVLVISEKGGTGKTTISQQVVATWLLKTIGAVGLIELDDVNTSARSSWLTKSKIKTISKNVGSKATKVLSDILFDEKRKDALVIDVGGNITSQNIINALKDSGQANYYAFAVVPVREEGDDVLVARQTINALREARPDFPILIALNNITDFDDVEDEFAQVFALANELDVEILQVPRMRFVHRSQLNGQTLYEQCEKREELLKSAYAEEANAMGASDFKKARAINEVRVMINSLRKTENQLNDVFDKLDAFIKADK